MKYLLVFLYFSSLWAVSTPQEGFERLQEGNKRFVKERLLHPNRTGDIRLSLKQGQSPYAVVVSCSDSRVVPEVVFDEGLGDLFVIRIAGNVIGGTELESVKYAINHLKPVIVVVMGHENCGAVSAVVKGETREIPHLAALISPAVEKAKMLRTKDLLTTSIKLNAAKMRSILLDSYAIDAQVEKGTLAVYAAYYNLQTGGVDFMDSPLYQLQK